MLISVQDSASLMDFFASSANCFLERPATGILTVWALLKHANDRRIHRNKRKQLKTAGLVGIYEELL